MDCGGKGRVAVELRGWLDNFWVRGGRGGYFKNFRNFRWFFRDLGYILISI